MGINPHEAVVCLSSHGIVTTSVPTTVVTATSPTIHTVVPINDIITLVHHCTSIVTALTPCRDHHPHHHCHPPHDHHLHYQCHGCSTEARNKVIAWR